MRQRKIAVVYHSQSAGNTEAAARHVIEAVEAGGFDVEEHNTDQGRLDPAILAECAGLAVGSPDYFSYVAGGLKVFIDDWLIARRGGNEQIAGIPVALFLTHGGGGVARGPLEELFRHIGPQVGETVMVKGAPGEKEAQELRDLGAMLVKSAGELLARPSE